MLARPERRTRRGGADVGLDRKPVDPPPVIQLKISDSQDPTQNYLQSTSLTPATRMGAD